MIKICDLQQTFVVITKIQSTPSEAVHEKINLVKHLIYLK